ncbi:carbohydrate ABC transporter permease [Massiliimalia massiliensis]|uniref:carbohydrate ABC transporter permease n=1 Tax=Massiliimalia massiliensis TaxID=1852384 RepID=UPI0009860288|nr:carbohydrate ABC transporter permease [Massiliimalia massiliensis]
MKGYKKVIGYFIKYFVLFLTSIFVLFPFLWTLITSLKPEVQIFAIPPIWLPDPVSFKNYIDAFSSGDFVQRFGNSVIIALGSTLLSMLIGIPASYGFARYPYKGSKTVFLLITAVRMLPVVVLGIPMYLMMRNLGLLDTKLALIIIYIPLQLTLNIWMMYGNFKKVPGELIQASYIDGLGPLSTLVRIVVPITVPMIAVATVFSFLASWNEFFFAMLTTSSARSMTLPVYIAGNITSQRIFWGRMTAMGIAFAIPAILFTLIAQKGLVRGLTAGAVKG